MQNSSVLFGYPNPVPDHLDTTEGALQAKKASPIRAKHLSA